MSYDTPKIIQQNSPDGGFLQSEMWRKFQESVGRKTYHIETETIWANFVEHALPIVGKYGYCPRGPVLLSNDDLRLTNEIENRKSKIENYLSSILGLAKQQEWGWVRIDPKNSLQLEAIRSQFVVYKAPHDVQPKQILLVDLMGTEDEVLNRMKQKTRYNIKLAQKRGVSVQEIFNSQLSIFNDKVEKFLDLIEVTAKRDKITSHPGSYYRKMLEAIPEENLKLYLAEYEGQIIAGVLVSFFGKYATYLHGASDNVHRNVMAPYLLQWHAMKEAKKNGCEWYDLGGISTNYESNTKLRTTNEKWAGITKFKEGFAPNGRIIEFPGSYDVIVNRPKYFLYIFLQKAKGLMRSLTKLF